MKKFIALTLSLLLCAGLMAGCGASAEQPESTLNTVEAGKLIMSTNAAFPPYEFMDGENIVGIDVEIADAIAKKLGYEGVEVMDIAFDSSNDNATCGRVTCVVLTLNQRLQHSNHLFHCTRAFHYLWQEQLALPEEVAHRGHTIHQGTSDNSNRRTVAFQSLGNILIEMFAYTL